MAATLVIWHGYLLGATGSNIYTCNLVDSWLRAGHDVVLVCQERDQSATPWVVEEIDLVLASEGDVVASAERAVREDVVVPNGSGRCTLVRPDVHRLLPVYVRDRYEGFDVATFVELTDDQRAVYDAAQRSAARWVIDEFRPDGVLVNHAVPLPAAVGPAFADAGIPYAVKVHGSELEYAIALDDRYVEPARAGLADAASVLVGSGHIAARTVELLGRECVEGRVDVVPPGVDLERFRPLAAGSRDAAGVAERRAATDMLVEVLRSVEASQPNGFSSAVRREVAAAVARSAAGAAGNAQLVDELCALHGTYEERHVDRGAADAVQSSLDPAGGSAITFVGKLIPQKGAQLLVAALPLVVQHHPDVQVLIAGFGPLREGLEALAIALGTGAEAAVEELARDLPRLAGGSGPDAELVAFFDQLADDPEARDAYWRAAAGLHERITWLGLVDHDVLMHAWPVTTTSVVPSILAEAFGMVAAEAAACGSVPVVADHSGLADAAAVIEQGGVAPMRVATSDPSRTVERLADALSERLSLPAVETVRQARAARANVAAAWGWDALAVTVAELMQGRRTPV